MRNIHDNDQYSKAVQNILCFMKENYHVQSSSVQPDGTGREKSTEKCARNTAT